MSLVLITSSLGPRAPRYEVTLVTSLADLKEVQRLRHRVYVHELGIVAPDHEFVDGDRLVDPYDGWSTHLLLRVDGVAAGTVRVTEQSDGELELARYTSFAEHLPSGARPAELTRYMVLREHRGSMAGPLLLYCAFHVIVNSTSDTMVAAAKLGSLSTYYTRAGLRVTDAPPFEYGLTGCTYRLGFMDLGRPGSLRRAAWKLGIGAWYALGIRYPQALHLLFRRRPARDPGGRRFVAT
ncbi:MAG TPA: GNAT family N-acyltransferase [Myxococcota bacterium]|nr:GNAT family N-acyltransferase [Myxococcota bacterium]